MSNLAPLPPGFVLMDEPQPNSATVADLPPGFEEIPPPPAGFEMMTDVPQPVQAANPMRPERPAPVTASGDVNGRTGSTFLGAMDGMSFGLADEIGARINSTVDAGLNYLTGREGKTYDQWLGKMRGLRANAEEQHPGYFLGGQLAGSVAQAGGITKAAPELGAKALGIAGRTIPERAGAAMASGFGMSALHGAGSGEGGLLNRSRQALEEDVVGAGAGLVAYPAATLVGKGVRSLADIIASRSGPVSRNAQSLITDTLGAEGLTLEEANRLAQQHGPTAMLADATEGLRYRTEQLANADTPARSNVVNALRDRSRAAGERIGVAYDAALGERPNVFETVRDMSRQMKERADPLYAQARTENLPVDVGPVISKIDDMMLTPAEKLAGRPDLPDDAVDAALLSVRRHLSSGDVQATGIDKLDRLERRIRARTDVAFKTGHSDEGHALNEVGKLLREQLKASSPVYKKARETYADDAAVKSAFETGQGIFGSKVHPDFLAAEVADMSEAERQALRVGVRSAVDQATGSVRNGTLKGRQLLDSDFNERKILTVLGEDDGRRLINSLHGEQAMADTANSVLGGSATARRMDNPFRTDAPAIPRVPQGLVHAGLTAAQKGIDVATAAGKRRLAQEVEPILTATGTERDRLVQALIEQAERRGQSAAVDPERQALIEVLTRGGALAYGRNQLR